MSPRAFLTLAVLTVVAVIGAAWVLLAEQRASTIVRPTDAPLFPALTERADEVQRIEIKNRNYDLTLERQGDIWVVPEMGNYPVRVTPVGLLVSGIASLKPYEAKTNNPEWYDEIEVGEPGPDSTATLVNAYAADGEVLANVIIGKASSSIGFNPLGGTFVREPDEAQAWLAEGQVTIPPYLSDWFDPVVHIPGPDIRRITILEGDAVVFDAEKTDIQTGDYELVSLDPKYTREEGLVAEDNAIKRVATGVVSTTFENVRPESDLARAPDARTVRFVTANQLQLEVRLGEINGETWVAYTATAPAGSEGEALAQQISDRTQGFAFKLPPYRTEPLLQPVSDLVEKPGGEQPPMPGLGGGPQIMLPNQPLIPRLPGMGGAGIPGLPRAP